MTARDKLIALADNEYKTFMSRLVPTVPPDTVLGVRVPRIRELAKQMVKDGSAWDFVSALPHELYEENMLHALIISNERNFQVCIDQINELLPYVDNWGVCDSLRPACFKNKKKELYTAINEWLNSSHTYTVRFAVEMLMIHFLDDHFTSAHLDKVAKIESKEYYVRMMVAWYFATALAKQYDYTLPYIEEQQLSPWTHNKTIQKAVESYRLTDGQKAYLKTLKIK